MTTSFMLQVMIKKKLKEQFKNFETVINWFYENYKVLNTGNCYYMFIGKDVDENETLQISSQQKTINSKKVEILGIKTD